MSDLSVLFWIVCAVVLLAFGLAAGFFFSGCVMLFRTRVRDGIVRILGSLCGAALLSFALLIGMMGEPGFTFEGTVESESGTPIIGASVGLECTPGFPFTSATTDEMGTFHATGIGWQPDDCPVVVHAQHYESFSAPIGSYCVARPWHLRNACLHVSVHAKLKRAA